MKKSISVILFAIISGIICAFLVFNNKNNIAYSKKMEEEYVYGFQMGVYNNYDNALVSSNRYNGIILNGNNKFYVYSVFIKNEGIKKKLEEYYKNLNINYYIKRIKVDSSLIDDTLEKKLNEEINENVLSLIVNNYKGVDLND